MIYLSSTTGRTVTAQAYQGASTVGASFSLTEIGSTGIYFAAYPSLSAGEYLIAFSASGSVLGSGVLVWDGSGEITTGYTAPANADIAAIKAKTDTLTNGPSLAVIEGSTVLAKEATVISRATQASVDALGSPAQAAALATLSSANQTEHDATQVAIAAIPAPLDSTATQAATAAALAAYDGLVVADIAGLATAGDVTSAQTAIIAEIDAIPTNPLLTNDARLNNLDAAISTRLASAGYTAPANADIAAIKAKTDTLTNGPTLAAIEASTVLAKQTGFTGIATSSNVTAAQAAIIAEIDAIPAPASAPTAIENAAAVRVEIDAELALIRNNVPLIPAGI